MKLMSGRLKPLNVPFALSVVGLAATVISLRVIGPSTRKVATATANIQHGECEAALPPVIRRFCDGMVLLGVAGNPGSAREIVDSIQAGSKTQAAVTSLDLDYILIPSYVAFLAFFGAAMACVAGLLKPGWFRTSLRAVLVIVAASMPVAGVLDGIEDVGLRTMLLAQGIPPGVAEWTFSVSRWKWWLIAIGLAVPLAVFVPAVLYYVATHAGSWLTKGLTLARRLTGRPPRVTDSGPVT